ncbi:MAG TPA: cation:proton antiporter [Phnomibacter sp.]|nr:cation:proton antiporter [Phnomibacter sp.]
MHHLPNLITELALILGAAGVTTLLFRRLRQPVVLGYVIAGFIVGPNSDLFPAISEIENIKTWAEIGVIFLLFALGLEFSFKKLAKVGASAGITGVWEISIMMSIGFLTGTMLGWSRMDSIFLGGIIAISSTTIIFRAFDELGLKTRQFTNLVLGVLIVEDLVAIILLVLLSTVAVSQSFAGTEMLFAILKLAFFLSLWFLLGIFLLPTLLKRASRWLSSETLLIGAIALCLGMVVLADRVGFSAALGAFIMGSILSETMYGEKIETLISSVKDLFGAIFFVSVGMLIDPYLLVEYAGPVVLLTLIVIVGKLVNVTTGALIAGRPLRQAVQAGTSMTQIGEFSFIIATLGLTLKVTSNYLYPIAVGVSVITTFTTPFMIRMAEPLHRFLERRLPKSWLASLNRYSAGSQIIRGESDWRIVFGAYSKLVLTNSVVIIALILFSNYYLQPTLMYWIEQRWLASLITALVSLGMMAPFIWALMAKKIQRGAYRSLWLDSKYNRGPLVMLELFRNLLGILFVSALLWQFFPLIASLTGTVIIMVVVFFVFRQRLHDFYHRIEDRFLSNLNEKEMMLAAQTRTLTPWDAHLSRIRIGTQGGFIGETLERLQLREKYGINIAFIERGNRLIYAPSRLEKLYPHDEIGVIGTDRQLQRFTRMVESKGDEENNWVDAHAEEISLEKIVVDENTGLKGLSIRDSGIREKTNGLVVGIERRGERMLNPSSATVFEWADVVWLVGDRNKIRKLNLPREEMRKPINVRDENNSGKADSKV